jgi:hypothetical protein
MPHIVFLRSWALVAPYLCYRFCIFNRPILEEYVSKVKKGPTPPLVMPLCNSK